LATRLEPTKVASTAREGVARHELRKKGRIKSRPVLLLEKKLLAPATDFNATAFKIRSKI